MSNSIFKVERAEDSTGFLLWQTTITWQRQIKKTLEPYDLAHAQFVILAILLWLQETKQVSTQVMIARLSKLDKMTVSKSLRKLISLGYISRFEHVLDTRAKTVELTKKGYLLIAELVPIVESIDEKFFSILNTTEQRNFNNFLLKLIADKN